MIIIYDSDKPAHERVTVQVDAKSDKTICGCFDITIETTIRGKAAETLHIKRWGPKAYRDSKHKLVGEVLAVEAKP